MGEEQKSSRSILGYNSKFETSLSHTETLSQEDKSGAIQKTQREALATNPGPEFYPQNPYKKCGIVEHACNPSLGLMWQRLVAEVWREADEDLVLEDPGE